MSTRAWTTEELSALDAARELEIAVRRGDGRLGRGVPIWVVVVDEEVFVRTWYRRDTGWYGAVLRSGRARIRVPGVEADAVVEPHAGLGVDEGYRVKYGDAGARSMVTAEPIETTLRIRRAE